MTHYFLFLKLQEIKQISKFKSFQNLSSSIWKVKWHGLNV
jgi:hypothetical protein